MKLKTHFLILVLWGCHLFVPSLALGQTPDLPQSCPEAQSAEVLINDKIESIENQAQELSHFINGQFNNDFDLERYFAFDVSKDSEVLEILKDLKNIKWKPASTLIDCFENNSELKNKIDLLKIKHQTLKDIKLKFLELPIGSRQVLINSFLNFKKHDIQASHLKKEETKAIINQQKAEKEIILAENEAKDAQNIKQKEVAVARVVLEEKKAVIANQQAKWAQNLKKRQDFYKDMAIQLGDLSAQTSSDLTATEVMDNYNKISGLWRLLSKKIYLFYKSSNPALDIPDLPQKPNFIEGEDLLDEAKDYLKSYNEAQSTREAFIKAVQQNLTQESQENFKLLLIAGKLRAQYISILSSKDKAFSFDEQTMDDLKNELKIIPYRWIATFYSRILDIKEQSSLGLKGYINLSKDFGVLLLIIAVLLSFWVFLKNITNSLNKIKINFIRSRHQSYLKRNLAMLIPKVSSYLPWLISLFIINVSEGLLDKTRLAEFGIFLPYIEYYILYGLLRTLVTDTLINLTVKTSLLSSVDLRQKIRSTAKAIGLFLLISVIILHTVSAVARQGLLYRVVWYFSLLSGIMIGLKLIYQWKKEIQQASESFLSLNFKFLYQHCQKWWAAPVLLFCIVLLILQYTLNLIIRLLSNFKLSKKISAKIFQKQIERSTSKNSQTDTILPSDYTQWFEYGLPSDDSLLIEPKIDLLSDVTEMIEEWQNNSEEEHTLAIYGNKGSGKSCVLKLISEKTTDLRVIHDKVPPKLSDRQSVLDYISKLLGVPIEGNISDLYKADKDIPKTLVLLDEGQNFFLAKVNGFEGFKTLLDVINLKTKNLFWCMAFNKQSWNYLFDAFGRHDFFRTRKKLDSWSDGDIQNLIELRHGKSGYSLSYDQIISAAASNQKNENQYNQIEKKFFQLLWEQSDGNPRTAIHLWLSSLTPTFGKQLKVGLPREDMSYDLNSLQDDLHFVYVQIVKHENLNTQEAIQVTNLPYNIVSHALKIGLERSFLQKTKDGRYRITPSAQESVLKFLTLKNFIYGN